MSTFQTIEQAREYFKGDRFAMENGITLDALGADACVCSMEIEDGRHRNAAGGVMGGVIFTLADFAFAVASNNLHHVTVALQVSINYLGAVKGRRLTARAKCVKDGRTTSVFNIDVTDDTGRLIAQFVGTGYKM
ncbi:MAG: PaaI family thioesterase [Clostridia bacterium]|nr:PaaI family thioesterase [Clostridia bacterium]